MHLFSVCYRHPVTRGTVSFYLYGSSRETLFATLPPEHPRYDGYRLASVS